MDLFSIHMDQVSVHIDEDLIHVAQGFTHNLAPALWDRQAADDFSGHTARVGPLYAFKKSLPGFFW
jgi:hypothetical protein